MAANQFQQKPLRILHLDFDDLENPGGGGQARRTYEISKRLVKRGHHVTVITLPYPGSANKVKDGIHYERFGFTKGPWSYLSFFFGIPFMLWTHQFDLVIEENISPFTFGLSPLWTRKPVIAVCQCYFARFSSIKHRLPFWLFEKYGSIFYKNFIVLTRSTANQIRKTNIFAKIKILANGLSTPKKRLDISDAKANQKPYVFFLGRIDYFQKGLDHLINIAKALQQIAPEILIKVAGDGFDTKKFLQEVSENSLSNIKYIGRVAGPAKAELLRNCIALIQPSRFEIFPFTILEAAAFSKPTICFDIENLQEIVTEKNGIRIPSFNASLFAKTIYSLYKNKKKLSQLGSQAQLWALKHNWDRIVDEEEKFYYEAIKK